MRVSQVLLKFQEGTSKTKKMKDINLKAYIIHKDNINEQIQL